MKKTILLAVAVLSAGPLLTGADLWDSGSSGSKNKAKQSVFRKTRQAAGFAAVQEKAEKEKKPILLSFNGSDWCGWCIKLDNEVFAKKEFKKWANKNVVMYVADFPRKKKLPEDVQQQNRELANKYRIGGYPTVLLLNADGSVIARTGYQRGGAENYVRHLESLLKKK